MRGSKVMTKKRVGWCVVVLVVLIISLYLQPSSYFKPNENRVRIGMIPKVSGISYFDQCAEGAREVAETYGMELIYRGPTSANAAAQVNIVQTMIYEGVDVIAIAPIDPNAVRVVLEEAREKGILVVTYDADATQSSRDLFVSQVSAQRLGEHLVNNLVSLIGTEGDYAILTASLTADNQNTWIYWMKKYQEEQFPEINLLTIIPTDEDRQKAYGHTRNLIQAYPELDAIIAMSTEAGPGAAEAMKALDDKSDVKLYALATPKGMSAYLKMGAAHKATLWNPYDLGRLTVEVIHTLLQGENLVDRRMYGDIGPTEYSEDRGVVIMGAPLDFDAENVDLYDF